MKPTSSIYQPHANAPELELPPITLSVSSSSTNTENTRVGLGLRQWIKGPSTMPIQMDDPALVDAYRERWRLKWEHYEKTFPLSSLSVQSMTGSDIKERVRWLESDFNRIQGNLADIPSTGKSGVNAEGLAGISLVNELIEELRSGMSTMQRPTVVDQTGDALQHSRDQLLHTEIVYHFALQSNYTIQGLRQRSMAKASGLISISNRPPSHRSETQSDSRTIDGPGDPDTNSIRLENWVQDLPDNSAVDHRVLNGTPTMFFVPRPHHQRPGHGDLEQDFGLAPPPRAQNAQTQLSSAASHKASLGLLIAIAFFGASMTWSTVFSGSRGDLVIISWSASVFMVGAMCAAAASILANTDESILTKYIQVRWTVRILTVISLVHVFVGVLLLSAAIVVLDPNADIPERAGGQRFGRSAMIGAGVYAMAISIVATVTCLVIRRRYSYHTWRI